MFEKPFIYKAILPLFIGELCAIRLFDRPNHERMEASFAIKKASKNQK